MSTSAVEVRGVSMLFGDKTALDRIDLSIEPGAFVVLLGPSGGGKTTLLNIVGGFLKPTRGSVLIDGTDVTTVAPARRPTTTVFQDYALFPHMRIGGNVGFGLRMRGVAKPDRETRVARALSMVGLEGFARRRVDQLSGGQRQRVALARALVVEPSVLLLDEPLGALDLKLRRQMQDELKAIQKRVGTTFVHVTHDQEEAMAIADTVVVMNHGGIEDAGSPERVYLRPATRFTANFMGDNNLIPGHVKHTGGATVAVETALGVFELAGNAATGAAVALSVRPEHLHTEAGGARVAIGRGQVTESGFFGTHHQCATRLDPLAHPLKVRLSQRHNPHPGEPLALYLDPGDLVLLTR